LNISVLRVYFKLKFCESFNLSLLDGRGTGFRSPAEAGNFSLLHRFQIGSGAFLASIQRVPGVLSRESGLGVKLTTHLLLVLRSRMHGAITQHAPTQDVFMMWFSVKHNDDFTCFFFFTFVIIVCYVTMLLVLKFTVTC